MSGGWIDDELRSLRELVERLNGGRDNPDGSAGVPARGPDAPPTLDGGAALPRPDVGG